MRGDGGVAGEGRIVGVPKFHSWSKCTMPSMNIISWMSNASSGLCNADPLNYSHFGVEIPTSHRLIVKAIPYPRSVPARQN